MTEAMDPKAQRFLAMVGLAGTEGGAASVAERRASFARLMRFSRAPLVPVAVEERVAPGCGGHDIPLRIYTPSGASRPSAGLVWFHGGGLVAGSLDTHDSLCRSLAAGSGCRLVGVGYRLAPEHPFPAAILDAYAAVRFCAREVETLGLMRTRLGVGGDSGGGTLAAIVARVLGRRLGLKAQVLLCPVLDFVETRPSKRDFGAGHLLDDATMAADLALYAPCRPLDDPRVSPLRAEAAGLPPTLIHTAGFDPLRDEGHAHAARLRAAGVDVRHTDHGSLVHHFYGLTGAIPAATPALDAIAREIGEVLARKAAMQDDAGKS